MPDEVMKVIEEFVRKGQAGQLIIDEMISLRNAVLEEAYKIARGGDDRFKKHGTNQMYWKGRADAATEIRAAKSHADPDSTKRDT